MITAPNILSLFEWQRFVLWCFLFSFFVFQVRRWANWNCSKCVGTLFRIRRSFVHVTFFPHVIWVEVLTYNQRNASNVSKAMAWLPLGFYLYTHIFVKIISECSPACFYSFHSLIRSAITFKVNFWEIFYCGIGRWNRFVFAMYLFKIG